MKTFNHVLTTWTISIFFMLAIAIGYEYYQFNPGNFSELFGIPALPLIVFAFFGAIPSLLISWVILIMIMQTPSLPAEKYLLWLIATLAAVSLNILLPLLFFFREEIALKTFFFFWPAYAGAIMTTVLRSKQFFSLIKTIQHENNLV